MLKKKNLFIIILLLFLFFVSIFLFIKFTNNKTKDKTKINIKENIYTLIVSRTDEDKARGLMNVSYMKSNEGMIFIYENEVKYGFWMKNCLIPLDMIFINKDGKVVDINKNALPCKENIVCPTYYPDFNYKYVIELNSGQIDEIDLKIGDIVKIDEIT